MNNKKPSAKLEEKLQKLSFNQKAKSWNNFDEKQFEKDAKRVKSTFKDEDENLLSERNYL